MKRFPVVHVLAVFLAVFVLGIAGTADALTYGPLPTTFAPPGSSGLSSDNFTYDKSGSVEVGLKAHLRYLGEVTSVGNVYYVPTGYSPVSSGSSTLSTTVAAWNYDWSVNLGATPGNYDVYFGHDIDTGAGISMTGFTFLGGTFPMSGSLWQDSQNFGFSLGGIPQGGPAFDATKIADYNFILSVYNHGTVHDSSTFVAGTEMLVRVGTPAPVPIPGALLLFGSGLLGLVGISRKRLKK